MVNASPEAHYRSDIENGILVQDDAQAEAVSHLESLYRQLCQLQPPTSNASILTRLLMPLRKRPTVQGLYLWGGVGRGKTYLMDIFFDALPFEQKMRTHFHRFMRRIHRELKSLEGQKNPLDNVASTLASEAKVICFDEFFVSDITDAMILGNLLKALFDKGVVLVATSNVKPQDLYRNGLQRARFLPAIDLINQHTQTLNVDGGVDYRLRELKQVALYHYPANVQAQQALEEAFGRLSLCSAHVQSNVCISVEGREIKALKVADDVAWFDFVQLCDGPRSQNDYVELAKEYHAVLISNVPLFDGSNDDQARRFIFLVDEFYDCHVKLIVSAAVPVPALYNSHGLAFEFERTASRLLEMQSEAYLASAHRF